jgi:hypothetical protein
MRAMISLLICWIKKRHGEGALSTGKTFGGAGGKGEERQDGSKLEWKLPPFYNYRVVLKKQVRADHRSRKPPSPASTPDQAGGIVSEAHQNGRSPGYRPPAILAVSRAPAGN